MEPGASYMIRQNFTSSIDVMLVNILNKFYSDLMLMHRNCPRGRNLTFTVMPVKTISFTFFSVGWI